MRTRSRTASRILEPNHPPRPPRALLPDPPRDDVDLSQPASVVDAWVCNKGALRVDPPAQGPAAPANTRGQATGDIPFISQTGEGDFHAHRPKKVAFEYWARHVFLNEDGRALRDRRFRGWVLNTRLRHEADGQKDISHREAPGARDLNLRDVKQAAKQELVRKMILPTGSVPGTIGDAFEGRKKLNAMVDQIEWETSRRGDNDGPGRIRAIFLTFTAAIYKWARLNRLIRRWADLPETVPGETPRDRKSMFPREENEYPAPAIAERYVSLKLEMMIQLCNKVLAVRGLTSSADVRVDDRLATFAWGSGGITHTHCLLWMPHSPRIDMAAKDEKARQSRPQKDILLVHEVAAVVSDYFRYFVSGTHPLQPKSGDENKLGAAQKSKKAADATADPSSTARGDLRVLIEGSNTDSEEAFGERLRMVGCLADVPNMHDWREPPPRRRPLQREVLR